MPSMQTNSPYRGSGSISREQFLFYEMRTTARLIAQGMNDREVMEQIVTGNLFQYPTEKTVQQMVRTCLHRLHGMGDMDLVLSLIHI